MDRVQLNTALKQNKIANEDKLEVLEKERMQLKTPVPWEAFLLEKKVLTEKQLLDIKSAASGVAVVDLTSSQILQDILNLVPEPIAHRLR